MLVAMPVSSLERPLQAFNKKRQESIPVFFWFSFLSRTALAGMRAAAAATATACLAASGFFYLVIDNQCHWNKDNGSNNKSCKIHIVTSLSIGFIKVSCI